MIKCKKCNSTNVKIDLNSIYTSIPPKYSYKCQDCNELNFIDCCEINVNDFNEDGFQKGILQNEENIETPKNENKSVGGLTGWICPKCGRCYSPFTSMCSYCGNNGDIWKVTCNSSSSITDLNIFKW